MSVATELTRIQTAKANLKTAIEAKGVTVSSSALIDTYPSLIETINTHGNQETAVAYASCSSPFTITPSAGYDGFSSLQVLPLPSDWNGWEISNFRLFYIDPNGDSEIAFYDRYLNEIDNIQAGDSPAFFEYINEGTTPKYYFYGSTPFAYPWSEYELTWTWKENGAFHYETLLPTVSMGRGMGVSQNACNILFSNYSQQTTEAENPHIWMLPIDAMFYPIFSENYVPSIGSLEELQALQTFLNANPSLDNPFTDNLVWTCSEINSTNTYAFNNGVVTETDKSTPGFIIPIWYV